MSTVDSEPDYAFWTEAGTGLQVQYSLPLFHEIDFQVNEGYRRISHGGVEIGGVLFGRSDSDSIRIEAFRLLNCEHAFGPSFRLSERDLAQVPALLDSASREEDLRELRPLGWFISHTRGPLILNEQEVTWFADLFPDTNQITLLVKPERFQPTRFGFIVRYRSGQLNRDASPSAIILPLPGRTGSPGKGVVPSIPAPLAKPSSPARGRQESEEIPPFLPTHPPATPLLKSDRGPESQQHLATANPTPVPERKSQPRHTEQVEHAVSETHPVGQNAIGNRPAKQPGALRNPPQPLEIAPQLPHPAAPGKPTRASNTRMVTVLVLAAVLGCGVGYWAYRQLPSPSIQLQASPRPSSFLLVEWDPEQTQSTNYAALRINDGEPVPLSARERLEGHTEIKPTTDNTKIELTVQHWARDSRGILRYVGPVVSSGK